jgi:hypothetical protein
MFSLKRLGVNIAGPLGFLDMYSMARSVLTHSQTSILMYHSVSRLAFSGQRYSL